MYIVNSLSFRDHDARVINHDGFYYRLIYYSYQKEYDHLMNSGLYEELLEKNLIIDHKEVVHLSDNQSVYKTILPRQIEFLSYPYEWTTYQWRKAILAYIEINQISLKYGMILKDATPYNFYFKDSKPIMFDTSSFIFFEEGDSWLAYRQFCEAFLGPTALIHYNSSFWIKLFGNQKTEMSLTFISKQLPFRSWFNFSILVNIHLHALFFNEKKPNSKDVGEVNSRAGLTKQKITFLLTKISSTIKNLGKSNSLKSIWSSYYEDDIQNESYLNSKEQIVKSWLENIKPEVILDLGANTGYFTKIAANYATKVHCLESDQKSLELFERSIEGSKVASKIYLINADITEPSPGIGFMNEETMPLINRISSDVVMGLALIHHLCFRKRLQLDQVAYLFNTFTKNYAIVEFVPNEDNKVKDLRKSNAEFKSDYSEETFLMDFGKYFSLIDGQLIGKSFRKLYLFRKKK